ncbi:MAG: hemolysin family protein [Eubacteriaceae bacterium]|jgi:putative hemolysin|nr:hemolysin family protein [Eubacteriaceae bacterium]
MDASPDPGLLPEIEIALLLLILLINGLLTAVDKAIESVNRNNIREMASDGSKRAVRLVKIFDDSKRFMSATTVTTIFFAFLTSAVAISMKQFSLHGLFSGLKCGTYIADLLLIMIVSCIFLVFAVFLPRQIALKHIENTALKLSGYAVFFARICTPFSAFARAVTAVILKLTRQGQLVSDEQFSEEEVMSMLEVGQEQGDIKEEGKKMIDSIFAFDDKLAYEIMTPRTDVFTIDINDDPANYMEQFMEMRYSRIPVYEGDQDNIIGILNIKDYLVHAYDEGFENVRIKEFLRKPVFVPETKNIDSLFFELQNISQHIAILIDEYGGFSGVVTMEDIIEEIVGDIDDEYDKEEPEIEMIDDNTFYVDGTMYIDDINEELGTDLESDNSETIGGLLIDVLGEIPDEDDSEQRIVEIDNYTFTILSVHDRRIARVKMHIGEKKTDDDSDKESAEQEKK